MAINNISILASSEKDALLAFKDNSLENNEEDLGANFLSQLNAAHSFIEPLQKGNKSPDAENSIAIPKHKQPEENENLSVKLDEITTDEVTFVSVEMLDQINSAQAMSTSINKPFDATKSIESENAMEYKESCRRGVRRMEGKVGEKKGGKEEKRREV